MESLLLEHSGAGRDSLTTTRSHSSSLIVLITGGPGCACIPEGMQDSLLHIVAHSTFGDLGLLKVLSYNGAEICFPVTCITKFPSVLTPSMLCLLLLQVADFQGFNDIFIMLLIILFFFSFLIAWLLQSLQLVTRIKYITSSVF